VVLSILDTTSTVRVYAEINISTAEDSEWMKEVLSDLNASIAANPSNIDLARDLIKV